MLKLDLKFILNFNRSQNVVNYLRANRTTFIEIAVKAMFDSLIVPLFVLLIGGLISQIPIDNWTIIKVFALGICHYIAAAIISNRARYWELRNSNIAFLRAAVAVVTIIATVQMVLAGTNGMYQITTVVMLLWIWYRATYFRIEDLPFKETRTYILAILLLATVLSYMPWVYRGEMTTVILGLVYPFFLMLGIVYLGLVNTHNVFMQKHENQINHTRNLKRYRRLSLLIGFVSWLMVQISVWILAGKGVLQWLVNGLSDIIAWLFYPIIFVFSKVAMLTQSRLAAAGKGEGSAGNDAGDLQNIKQMTQNASADWPWLEPLLYVIFAALAIVIFYHLFKRAINRTSGSLSHDDAETKTFIFEEAFKFPKLNTKLRFQEKDTVRVKYFQWLKYYGKEGYKIGVNETPSTYLKRLNQLSQIAKEQKQDLIAFNKLTGFYEKVRYGEWVLDKDEAINFKEIIDKPGK